MTTPARLATASSPAARRPQVGDIWREVDPRFEDRFIRVETVERQKIGIRTVVRDGPRWIAGARSRIGPASPDRFSGKRGGYAFVEIAPC